jgi:hypothetical protein
LFFRFKLSSVGSCFLPAFSFFLTCIRGGYNVLLWGVLSLFKLGLLACYEFIRLCYLFMGMLDSTPLDCIDPTSAEYLSCPNLRMGCDLSYL